MTDLGFPISVNYYQNDAWMLWNYSVNPFSADPGLSNFMIKFYLKGSEHGDV